MSDGKIYITISDRRGESNTPTPSVPGTEKKEKKDKNDLFAHWAKNKIIGEVKQLANTAVSYGISNYGNFTGDFQTQRDIEWATSILQDIGSVGTAISAGAYVGGVWGALIAGTISAANVTINKALSLNTFNLSMKRTNHDIDVLRHRAGLDVLLDGSRGTEN